MPKADSGEPVQTTDDHAGKKTVAGLGSEDSASAGEVTDGLHCDFKPRALHARDFTDPFAKSF